MNVKARLFLNDFARANDDLTVTFASLEIALNKADQLKAHNLQSITNLEQILLAQHAEMNENLARLKKAVQRAQLDPDKANFLLKFSLFFCKFLDPRC